MMLYLLASSALASPGLYLCRYVSFYLRRQFFRLHGQFKDGIITQIRRSWYHRAPRPSFIGGDFVANDIIA